MQSVIIVGAGGHAKVIIDILQSNQHYQVIGCTTAEVSKKSVLGVDVIGDDSILPLQFEKGTKYAFVAIGDNAKRQAMAQNLLQIGFELINVLSPQAVLSPSVKLGRGIAIMPGAVVNACASIGDNAIINTCASVDHDCIIEPDVHIGPGVHLAGCVYVCQGAFLGVGSSVIPNIKVGRWSTVGAGSVVIRNTLDSLTVVGVPAKEIKQVRPSNSQ